MWKQNYHFTARVTNYPEIYSHLNYQDKVVYKNHRKIPIESINFARWMDTFGFCHNNGDIINQQKGWGGSERQCANEKAEELAG